MSTTNLLAICQKAWSAGDLSTCKPLGLDAATWIAGLTAFVGVALFTVRWLIRRWRGTQTDPNYISSSLGRSRFRNLCRAIKPLMNENYRIFSQFGPNGGRGDGLPKVVRFDLGIWEQLREQIVENNGRIRLLIATNLIAVPQKHRPSFTRWLDHIDAFRAHVADPDADYTNHQFPREVARIVESNA